MIAAYNRMSFYWGIPGIILQFVGLYLRRGGQSDLMAIGGSYALLLSGTALLVVGLGYYAKAKGRHPAWCLMGFASIVGLVVLSALRDKAPQINPPAQ